MPLLHFGLKISYVHQKPYIHQNINHPFPPHPESQAFALAHGTWDGPNIHIQERCIPNCRKIYKAGGNNHPMVQPKSNPMPARPNPRDNATAYLHISRLCFFLLLLVILPSLDNFPLGAIQGSTGITVDIWCSFILSWRNRFSSCNISSHCLYANR